MLLLLSIPGFASRYDKYFCYCVNLVLKLESLFWLCDAPAVAKCPVMRASYFVADAACIGAHKLPMGTSDEGTFLLTELRVSQAFQFHRKFVDVRAQLHFWAFRHACRSPPV